MNDTNKLLDMDPEEIINLLNKIDTFLDHLISGGFEDRVITFAVTKCCMSKFSPESESIINSLHPIISAINSSLNEHLVANKKSSIQ